MGLTVSLALALGATWHGKETGGAFGLFPQPDGGAWYITVRNGRGFTRTQAIYARDKADGGDDSVQQWNNNHIVDARTGGRGELRIFVESGAPATPPARFMARLDPAPFEPTPLTYRQFKRDPDPPKKQWHSYLETLEAGWPMRCLVARVVGPKVDHTLQFESVYRGAVRVPFADGRPNDVYFTYDRLRGAIPYHPMPVGLAVNTIFWAGVLWLVFFGHRAVRRWWRARHGRCLGCGYDRTGAASPICPECGRDEGPPHAPFPAPHSPRPIPRAP